MDGILELLPHYSRNTQVERGIVSVALASMTRLGQRTNVTHPLAGAGHGASPLRDTNTGLFDPPLFAPNVLVGLVRRLVGLVGATPMPIPMPFVELRACHHVIVEGYQK